MFRKTYNSHLSIDNSHGAGQWKHITMLIPFVHSDLTEGQEQANGRTIGRRLKYDSTKKALDNVSGKHV
jgi:hypothetical protein